MSSRTAVLLGAGASVEAGLPLTADLAELIVKRANDEGRQRFHRSGAVEAINFVYGSMVGYQAEDGSNPLSAVNIERLISAVRLLRDAKSHEVAPFVASWRRGALGASTPRVSAELSRSLRSALSASMSERSHFSGDGLATAVAAIARDSIEGSDPHAFEVAEDIILEDLVAVLGSVTTVDYLSPLAAAAHQQPGGLDVLTLNYDLTVETMARQEGVDLNRGIESWIPGRGIDFQQADGRLNLIKLHGSLDWLQTARTSPVSSPQIEVREITGDADGELPKRSKRPWIVVGEREKLATDGPTLALLQAAQDALARADHLLIVGYSFGDGHINGLVRDWMLADEQRTLGVIETNWHAAAIRPFLRAFVQEYGFASRDDRAPRVLPLAGEAGSRLTEGLRARPSPEPAARVVASIVHNGEGVATVRARLYGVDLYDASVTVRDDNAEEVHPLKRSLALDTHLEIDHVEPEAPQTVGSWRPARISHWPSGDEVTVYCKSPVSGASLSVHGARLDAAFGDSIHVSPLAGAADAALGNGTGSTWSS